MNGKCDFLLFSSVESEKKERCMFNKDLKNRNNDSFYVVKITF